jgi:uncharacterized protein (DUF1499 family)
MSGLALRIYMGREAQDRLGPGEAVSIAALRSPLPRPSFLACPSGYCSAAEAIASPLFELPRDRLHAFWLEVISREKGMVPIVADSENERFVYVQHSLTFRFPDIITVEFVRLGSDRSSLAIYSQSRYGEFDFGKNRKRVERWLALLDRVARPATARMGRAP